MCCLDARLHCVDPRVELVHKGMDNEAAVACCGNLFQRGFSLASQESICYESLAANVGMLQHPLHHVAGCLVGGMLQDMRQQLLQAKGFSLWRAVLEEMLYHKICKCVARKSFQVIQELVQKEADLLLAAVLQQTL